jgi:hypothetical protein
MEGGFVSGATPNTVSALGSATASAGSRKAIGHGRAPGNVSSQDVSGARSRCLTLRAGSSAQRCPARLRSGVTRRYPPAGRGQAQTPVPRYQLILCSPPRRAAPRIAAWWTGRRLERAGDDPPSELILTRNHDSPRPRDDACALDRPQARLSGLPRSWRDLAGPIRYATGDRTGLAAISVKRQVDPRISWILDTAGLTPQIVLIDPRFAGHRSRWRSSSFCGVAVSAHLALAA